MKNLKSIADFADNIVGSYMSAWGCFTIIFFICSPLILVAAAIKWLISNGYIG